MEELLCKRHKTEGSTDKSGKAYTAFAQDTNLKAENRAGNGGTARPRSTSYHNYSTPEFVEEEVHAAFVLVYDQIPAFIQAGTFPKLFVSY